MGHWKKLAFKLCVLTQLVGQGCGGDDAVNALGPDGAAAIAQQDAAPVIATDRDAGGTSGTGSTSSANPGDARAPIGGPGDAGAPDAQTARADSGPGVAMMPSSDAAPMDGDPAKPVVAIAEVPCRNPSAQSFGLGRANLKVDERDVIIDYPCDKHEGAPMTFVLNLHGTTPLAQHFYQWSYFSAYKHVASHNLIIATPSSVVQQWGNGDNGADEPYLMHVIDWVYKTFAGKFDIRQMWVGGHSWGSFYTSRFGCSETLKDKVKGLILMSGAAPPACASRMSILNTAAGMPMPEGLLNQMANATAHGCDAQSMRAIDADNDETSWPNCDKGWVHANYMMKTKMHATSMDPSVVKSLVDAINLARP